MRKIFFIITFLCFAGLTLAQVQAQLQQPPPNQLKATDLWKAILVNSNYSTMRVTLTGTLEVKGEGIVVTGQSKLITLPKGTKMISYNDVKDGEISFKSGKWSETFYRTGKAPSGDYTICIHVKAEDGRELGSSCIDQNIIMENVENITPQLISPANESSYKLNMPLLFSWMLPSVKPGDDYTYKIKLVEIINHQSPVEAVKQNLAWFEKSDLKTKMLQYPLSAKKIEANKKYAWVVQLVDKKGEGVGENGGMSDAFTFESIKNSIPNPVDTTIAKLTEDKNKIVIRQISPTEGEPAQSFTPTFEWKTDKQEEGLLYSVIVKELQEKGEPESGVTVIEQNDIRKSSLVFPKNVKPLDSTKVYAWKVTASKKNKLVASSPFIIIYRKPTCKDFRVNITSSKEGPKDQCCFLINITNAYNGLSIFRPFAFKISSSNTIISAGAVFSGWSRNPSTIPPGTKQISWKKTSGSIPVGQINIGTLCFNSANINPFYITYEWLDRVGRVICKDSVKVSCRNEGASRPNCGKYAIALFNGISPSPFTKIRITSLPGSKIINAAVGDYDEDGGNTWNQTVGTNYSFVEWSYVGSNIPFDLSAYLDEEMYIWMDPSILANQEVRVDWYNSSNTIIASQKLFLPSLGDPTLIYDDLYDWESNTTKLTGNSLNIFAGAAPENCDQDRMDRSTDCSNNITYSVACVNNKPTLTFNCNPLVPGESTMSWNLTSPDGQTNTPTNNMELTQSGEYTLALTVNHTTVTDSTGDVTPADCDYEVVFNVSIPEPAISDPDITSSSPVNGTCNFKVKLNALQSTNLTSACTYSWLIVGPNNYSQNFTGSSVTNIFIDEGSYTATLTIKDGYGCTHTVVKTFILSYQCVPKFDWESYEWCKDDDKVPAPKDITIKFINKSQGGKCPQNYSWEFGDPSSGSMNTSTATTPQHTYYGIPGIGKTVTVKLKMTDASGCNETYTMNITIAPYFVDFTVLPCPDGNVHFSTTNDNPVWSFPGSNSTVSWVSQYVFGLFGWYHNANPVISYQTGDYTATLKATSNATHAYCIVSKNFHVEKLCCDWKVKDHKKVYNIIGGKSYRMRFAWKWKVKKFHPLNVVHTKIKVQNRVSKMVNKRWGWYKRVNVQSLYAGIEGVYYIKDSNGNCECMTPTTQPDDREINSNRGKVVYRPGIYQVRNIREQSMKAKIGMTVSGQTPWDEWIYFSPCQ